MPNVYPILKQVKPKLTTAMKSIILIGLALLSTGFLYRFLCNQRVTGLRFTSVVAKRVPLALCNPLGKNMKKTKIRILILLLFLGGLIILPQKAKAAEIISVNISVKYGQTEARKIFDMINEARTNREYTWYWNMDDITKTFCKDSRYGQSKWNHLQGNWYISKCV